MNELAEYLKQNEHKQTGQWYFYRPSDFEWQCIAKRFDSIEEIEKSWERIGKFTDNLAQYGMIDEDDC